MRYIFLPLTVIICMIFNFCTGISQKRTLQLYSYIYSNNLHIHQDILSKFSEMATKVKTKLVKKEKKEELNNDLETKLESVKTKKAVKKTPKSLTQTKLDFATPTASPTKWAKIPPLDPKEDVDEAYKKIAELREKSNVYIGAHVSASGGPEYSVPNAYNILGQSFALFLKNQRTWNWKALSKSAIEKFKSNMSSHNYDPKFVLPHASYLINMANPDPDKRNRAFDNFLDDIQRCEQLGIKLYNFHPGSTCGLCEKKEGIKHISDCINKALEMTKGVTIVLENAAGQKNVIGSKFDDLKQIIANVEDKSRVGVCLDTCHLFAAGYDIRTTEQFDQVMKDFDSVVGLKYLRAVHLNDSKSDLGSGLDRHENIGKGKLSEETFRFIVNSPYFKNIPIILETPVTEGNEGVYKQEVKLMYSLLD
ncbi:apurinic/apyrimidinic endonuclease Apn1-like, putative [Theileria annulata]|uniref:Apurinic/apyrimidinic endonuclease Apn1-like, putative n=1 Tax=Theileria annulata TaxID=5874 RepID=Q4UE35_THEAN|nr:apurinic/apyrimidinic endonuclease Apn1-like, putative [Theileria annulata]CAI74654.1 apurinic/apyrimidinic endonuclease Apn1-like, putative [Theileria annulata]|eukprot:XP_952386.1 apurinic/apyrimidinic endonuclease Apn1-like, putative [Theileria annulata]